MSNAKSTRVTKEAPAKNAKKEEMPAKPLAKKEEAPAKNTKKEEVKVTPPPKPAPSKIEEEDEESLEEEVSSEEEQEESAPPKKAVPEKPKAKTSPPKKAAPKAKAKKASSDEEETGSGNRFFKIVATSIEPQKGSPEIPESALSFKGGRFKGRNPMQAAKKAFTGLCNIAHSKLKYEGECSYIFTIQETSQGSKKKEFTYIGERLRLETPQKVTKNGTEYFVRFRSPVRSYSKPKSEGEASEEPKPAAKPAAKSQKKVQISEEKPKTAPAKKESPGKKSPPAKKSTKVTSE